MADDNKLGPVARRLAATQRVLCVEDEPDIATFLRAYFRAAGFDVVHVDPDDCDAVITAVEQHHPDAILLDLGLRGFSGREAYQRLRAEPRWSLVPIFLVSADTTASGITRPSKGFDAFVSKPFNTDLLAGLVRDRLAQVETRTERGAADGRTIMSHDDLEARLLEMLATATGRDRAFSFGLIRLVSMEAIIAAVGPSGRDHLVGQLIRGARAALPVDAVIGLTESDELAVLLPSHDIGLAAEALEPALAAASGSFEFAGGAAVPVVVACGLAAYPDHAADVDSLFMAADAALSEAVETGTLLHRAL